MKTYFWVFAIFGTGAIVAGNLGLALIFLTLMVIAAMLQSLLESLGEIVQDAARQSKNTEIQFHQPVKSIVTDTQGE